MVLSISFAALAGLLLLVPLHGQPVMEPDQALARVQLCLKRELMQHQLASLNESGRRLPDTALAKQWQVEADHLRQLTVVAIKVRRPLIDRLLSDLPAHLVRVELKSQEQQLPPRYFWLQDGGIDQETTRLPWLLLF